MNPRPPDTFPGRRAIGTVAFILLLLTGGCAAAVKPISPEVSLLDIKVGELTLSHATLLADLRIYNPNSVPITVRGLNYDFLLNGIRVATGQSAKEVTVSPEEYGTTTLRLSTGYLNLLEFTRGRSPGEAIRYAIDGKMKIGGMRVLDTVFPFLKEGELPIEKLPFR